MIINTTGPITVTAMKHKSENIFPKKYKRKLPRLSGNTGLTLIELMIAMAIFGMVIAGVVGAFYDQLRSHNTQQQILQMQQNVRAAMYFISRELRMAGYDPEGTANAGIYEDSTSAAITFSMDIGGGGDGADGVDNDGDGFIDAEDPDEIAIPDGDTADAGESVTYSLDGAGRITRSLQTYVNGTGLGAVTETQTLAVNIDALDFEYYGVDPANAGCTNDCYLGGGGGLNPDDIRYVEVSIVARSAQPLAVGYNVFDNAPYRNFRNDVILSSPNDNFRRIMLRKEITLRNLGLN